MLLTCFQFRDGGALGKDVESVTKQISEADMLIRLADAVAGATRTAYEEPQGKVAPLFKLIQPKIELRIEL